MNVLLVGAAPDGSPSLVAARAAEADSVIGIDGGALLCLAAGVTPSVVVGDLDSLPAADTERVRALGVPFELHSAEKDDTDLALALERARHMGATGVTLTAVIGGRFDHSLGAMAAIAGAADLRPLVRETDLTVACMTAPSPVACRVTGDGATFSAVALGGDAVISIFGAEWPLDTRRLSPFATLGISNRVVGDEATIIVHAGTVAVAVPREGDPVGRVTYVEPHDCATLHR